MNGRRLGNYEIVRRLGSGGMGVVWEARDTRLDRLVAVKTLPPEATGDAQARERLLQEARAAAALDHRNVCTVHDVGEIEEGGLYVVMALYRGRSLKNGSRPGPFRSKRRWTSLPRPPRASPPSTRGRSFTATSSPRTCSSPRPAS